MANDAYPVSASPPQASQAPVVPPKAEQEPNSTREALTALSVVLGAYFLALSALVLAVAAIPPCAPMPPLPVRLLVELACAAYLTDVISGTVHFTLDHADSGHLLRGEMPTDLASARAVQAGAKKQAEACDAWQRFVWKFQVHHSLVWPRSLTPKSQSQAQIDALVLAFAALMTALWRRGAIEQAWLFRVVVASAALAVNVQRAHFWCHERTHSPTTLPRAVRRLQDAGLLLHPEWHRVHHETYVRHFPIFNGWSDRYCQALFRTCVACGVVDAARGQKPTQIGPPAPAAEDSRRTARERGE